ncbi:hypothetical protein [Chryseobacterium gambrini]|uniref:hypothetical protein n=1 Tax=Chryseobacterium gambrini TaxID=373672 RepID=UPI0022F1486C|nr:hypothetical protein [Chryseobacterium gambrini]WBV51632.1 hypothetical protein PFY09_14995 [Chryseobacterium gambrini]
MRKLSYVLLLLSLINCKNKSSVFEVKINYVSKNIIDELKHLKEEDTNFSGLLYKDEKYEVWKSCSGEWGGTVYFKNLQNEIVHYAVATCPVSVNKINGKYYVSNSLAHMRGFSKILEIADPEKMETTKKIPVYHPDIITREYESESTLGTKKILDSTRVLIISSFVYNKKLYSIISGIDGKKTTISELKNNRFETVSELPEKIFYSEPIIVKKADNHLKLYFQHPQKGILEIRDNKIQLTYYEK